MRKSSYRAPARRPAGAALWGALLVGLALSTLVVACKDDDDDGGGNKNEGVVIKSVTVSPATATVDTQLTATAKDADGKEVTDAAYTWKIADTETGSYTATGTTTATYTPQAANVGKWLKVEAKNSATEVAVSSTALQIKGKNEPVPGTTGAAITIGGWKNIDDTIIVTTAGALASGSGTVNVATGAAVTYWALDGAWSTASAIELSDDVQAGEHTLFVAVTKDGAAYTATLTFTVAAE